MTTTYADLIRDVRGALNGYNLKREQATFLNGNITNSTLTLTVDDGTLVPAPCRIEIGSEVLDIQSVAGNVLTVSPDGRGFDGTTAASHLDNGRVTVNPTYPTWRIERAINNTITGVYPDVYGVASSSFTFNPSVTTYSLPAAAEGVLKVTTTVLGPSQDQAEIHGFKFNSTAPTTEFATGNCITLLEGPAPGRTVTVFYKKVPTELSTGNLTDSGLSETARRLVVYGAVAELLSYMDGVRALADSAVAKQMGNDVRVGSATQLAAQLTARYQMEVDQEKRRLRLAYPPTIRWMGR